MCGEILSLTRLAEKLGPDIEDCGQVSDFVRHRKGRQIVCPKMLVPIIVLYSAHAIEHPPLLRNGLSFRDAGNFSEIAGFAKASLVPELWQGWFGHQRLRS
jgi:hypothetical protein